MTDAVAEAAVRPTLADLLTGFAQISLSGFGGVLPFARRVIVERRAWMTPEQFNDVFALCQFLPGPNIVNFAVIFGSRVHGVAGAALALLGLLGPPVTLMIILGALYAHFGDAEALRRILTGMTAAVAGLVIATTLKMAVPLIARRAFTAPLVAAAILLAIGVAGWSLPLVLLASVPASIAFAWWERR